MYRLIYIAESIICLESIPNPRCDSETPQVLFVLGSWSSGKRKHGKKGTSRCAFGFYLRFFFRGFLFRNFFTGVNFGNASGIKSRVLKI